MIYYIHYSTNIYNLHKFQYLFNKIDACFKKGVSYMNKKMETNNFFDKFFSVIDMKSAKGVTIILAAVCIIMLFSIGYFYQKEKKEPEVISEYIGIKTQADESAVTEEPDNKIFVHITGEVNQPGLYELDENCRVVDAIEKAGGFTENAAVDRINLAEKLNDEAKLFVPSAVDIKNAAEKSSGSSKSNTSSAKSNTQSATNHTKIVNINSASAAELMTLPGIGEVFAERIVMYRAENGPFNRLEDIMRVSGISKGKFDAIKDYIKL